MNTTIRAGTYKPTATTEPQRLAALDQFANTGAVHSENFEALLASARADGRSWPTDLAQAIIRDIQQTNNSAAHATTAALLAPVGASQQGHFPDLHAVEQDAAREWAASSAIRQEFTSREAFLAFRKAEARGQVGSRVQRVGH